MQKLNPKPDSLIERILTAIFPFKNIDRKDCREYLHRWVLLKLWGGRRVYLHHFLGSDWSTDMHDHPKVFVSLGIQGGYVEEVPRSPEQYGEQGGDLRRKRIQHVAPWVRWFPGPHVHRVRINRRVGCWTICYLGKRTREWGFFHRGRWVWCKEYGSWFGGCD